MIADLRSRISLRTVVLTAPRKSLCQLAHLYRWSNYAAISPPLAT